MDNLYGNVPGRKQRFQLNFLENNSKEKTVNQWLNSGV